MKSLKKILVFEDPFHSSHLALQRAADLAKALGASIELFNCGYTPIVETLVLFDRAVQRSAEHHYVNTRAKVLNELAKPLREQGIDVHVDATWSRSVYRGIVRKVLHSRPDLVVVEAHRPGMIQQLMSNYIEWELVKHCPAPLLLIKLDDWPKHRPIVAGIDALEQHLVESTTLTAANQEIKVNNTAKEVLAAAQQMAQISHSSCVTVHCRPAFTDMGPLDELGFRDNINHARSLHEAAVNQVIADADFSKDQLVTLDGPPAFEISQYARQRDAQMVVLGGSTKSGLKQVFLGSNTHRIMDHVNCDVLIVKEKDFETTIHI